MQLGGTQSIAYQTLKFRYVAGEPNAWGEIVRKPLRRAGSNSPEVMPEGAPALSLAAASGPPTRDRPRDRGPFARSSTRRLGGRREEIGAGPARRRRGGRLTGGLDRRRCCARRGGRFDARAKCTLARGTRSDSSAARRCCWAELGPWKECGLHTCISELRHS
jgi:hypothetical protein